MRCLLLSYNLAIKPTIAAITWKYEYVTRRGKEGHAEMVELERVNKNRHLQRVIDVSIIFYICGIAVFLNRNFITARRKSWMMNLS